MKFGSIRHKALRRLVENDDDRGIGSDISKRVRNILAALYVADNVESLAGPPGWRIHQLSGSRAGTWSISASGNWRITFQVEDGEIIDLDLEDYH